MPSLLPYSADTADTFPEIYNFKVFKMQNENKPKVDPSPSSKERQEWLKYLSSD